MGGGRTRQLPADDPASSATAAVVRVDMERDGDRLVVRVEDPAAVNAVLVGAGLRVTELHAERRGLEQVVLDATEGSGDVR